MHCCNSSLFLLKFHSNRFLLMPLTHTVTISPVNPCSGATPPTFTFSAPNSQVGDFSAVGNVLTVNAPNVYSVGIQCAGDSFFCGTSAQRSTCCYSSCGFPSGTSLLNVTIYNPSTNSNILLNAQPGMSFPYALTPTGLDSFRSNYTAWGSGSGVTLCTETTGYSGYTLTPSGSGNLALRTWCRPVSITTNTGTYNFITSVCNPPSLTASTSVAGLNLSSTIGGCASPVYCWINPSGTVISNGSTAVGTISGTYSLFVLCANSLQWVSTNAFIP